MKRRIAYIPTVALLTGIIFIINLTNVFATTADNYLKKEIPASGMRVRAISEYSSNYSAGKAIDGNAATSWVENASGQNVWPDWFIIDLGGLYTVEKVKILPRQDNDPSVITKWEIYTSKDYDYTNNTGNFGTEPVAVGEEPLNRQEKDIVVKPAVANAVKIVIPGTLSGTVASAIAEVRVFGNKALLTKYNKPYYLTIDCEGAKYASGGIDNAVNNIDATVEQFKNSVDRIALMMSPYFVRRAKEMGKLDVWMGYQRVDPGLHLHPDDLPADITNGLSFYNPSETLLTNYTLDQQKTLIGRCVAYYNSYGYDPIWFRGGFYSANNDTMAALASETNIRRESHNEYRSQYLVTEHQNIVNMPVLAYDASTELRYESYPTDVLLQLIEDNQNKYGDFIISMTHNYILDSNIRSRVSGVVEGVAMPGNLARTATASASSTYGAGYEASKANDGVTSTRWNAASGSYGDEWLKLDFGTAKTFNKTIVREFENRISSYKIQYDNGSSWVDLVNGTTIGSAKTDNFNSVTTQYVRLYINTISSGSSASIYEFEVYAPVTGGSPIPTPTPGPQSLVDENFNSQTTGSQPSGWTVNNAPNTSCTIAEVPDANDKSMKFEDNNLSGSSTAKKTFTAQTGTVTAEWKFKEITAGNWPKFLLYSGGATASEMYVNDNSNLIYRNSSGTDVTIQSVSSNTWYSVKIIASAATDKFDIHVDGVLKTTEATFRNAVNNIDGILFGSGNSFSGAVYINDLKVSAP